MDWVWRGKSKEDAKKKFLSIWLAEPKDDCDKKDRPGFTGDQILSFINCRVLSTFEMSK